MRGAISFAQNNPRDRTTNVFINLGNSYALDSLKFAPFAHVMQGMSVVDSLYSGYAGTPIMNKPAADPVRFAREALAEEKLQRVK